jgi:tether containing UBX domain for GLUT4
VIGIPPAPTEDPKPTPAELKVAFSSHIAQKNGPDAPLMTKAMREREEARLGIKKKEYNEVRVG